MKKIERLGKYISEYSVRNKNDDDIQVYSVTNTNGFCTEYFDKDVASKDQTNYKIVPKGYFAYNPSRINVGSIDCQTVEDRVIVSPLYVVFKADEKRVDNDYLLHYLKSDIGKKYINELASGSVRANLKFSILQDFPFPMIPIEEQKEKMAVIAKIDENIACCDSIIEKLDLTVKSRFIEMFGDPESNPIGWRDTTIGEVCYSIKDGPHKSLADIGKENGGHPFISVRNVVNGYIDFSTAKYISDEDYAEARKKCCPQKGDMIYTKGGNTGIAKLIDVNVEFANWVHLAILKFDKGKLNGVFFENMLNSDYCYEQSQHLTKGIANRDLVLSAMAKIRMYIPPKDIQDEFEIFVHKIDKSKLAVQEMKNKMEILKASVMQDYFC
ncbi:MAG: restriction endonuclease subunit S [Butyrivibrio sp.]|nr:restriction endonuclease subunit S [Butyrivibrio sp.]